MIPRNRYITVPPRETIIPAAGPGKPPLSLDPFQRHPAPAPSGNDTTLGVSPPSPRVSSWWSGFTVSVPLAEKRWSQVDPGMRRYLVMAIAIGFLVLVVVVVIIVGASLHPGMIDPETKAVRFISDGFKVSTPARAALSSDLETEGGTDHCRTTGAGLPGTAHTLPRARGHAWCDLHTVCLRRVRGDK